MIIRFDKMEGAGNDFIMVDNRSGAIPDGAKAGLAETCCRRGRGIGADGMIFVQPDADFDFSWDFYNSDGSRAEMCGNGARCVVRFAHSIGAAGRKMIFRTLAGPIEGTVTERGAKVRLPPVRLPKEPRTIRVAEKDMTLWFLNTGVPHAVAETPDLDGCDVVGLGRAIRWHESFAPAGTNVNFFHCGQDDTVFIRTYERGVEDETLACGTGSAATGIVAALFFGKKSPISVQTRGGEKIIVYFERSGNSADPLFLEGGARLVFSGTFDHIDF